MTEGQIFGESPHRLTKTGLQPVSLVARLLKMACNTQMSLLKTVTSILMETIAGKVLKLLRTSYADYPQYFFYSDFFFLHAIFDADF